MTGILLKLKRLLTTMQDYELADMELWIDNMETAILTFFSEGADND